MYLRVNRKRKKKIKNATNNIKNIEKVKRNKSFRYLAIFFRAPHTTNKRTVKPSKDAFNLSMLVTKSNDSSAYRSGLIIVA